VAQDVCQPIDTELVTSLVEACTNASLDTLCTADGEESPLAEAAGSDGEGQPQVIHLSGTDADSSTTVYLVGGAILEAYEQGSTAALEIANRMGYNVNLRSGPGSNFDVIGIFNYDERLFADGQSADHQWIRVILDDGLAWVGAGLVAVDPAIADLPIVDASTSAAFGHTLTIGVADPACGENLSEAVVSTEAETPQRLTINGAQLTISDGAILVALDESGATIYALDGEINVGMGEASQRLQAGDVIEWTGSAEIPDPVPAFPPLDLVSALPLRLELCLVVSTDDNGVLDTLSEPNSTATSLESLANGGSYPAIQQALVNEMLWLRLAEAYGAGWVSADTVTRFGNCTALPDTDTNAADPLVSVPGAGFSPDKIMMNYLAARVTADGAQMQQLACTAWDAQAALQSQSFRAMRAELVDVGCSTTQQSTNSAVVVCTGHILTEYNGEFRQWEIGAYQMTRESGAWRVCGEAS
jgi:uncharacterized protein YraI